VSGWAQFDDRGRADDARRLLDLRYRLSSLVADEYAAAGFAVDFTVAESDRALATTPRRLGLWLDTTGQTPGQSVMEAWTRRAEARIT
jgi:hypothetical protein